MNLSSDPWIPIVWSNGAAGTVSLNDAFLRGRDIRDLAVRPHERIALMRLLLCVAHAALDGPVDRGDWATCLDRLPAEVAKYLRRRKSAFELFGDGPRFQQWTAASEPTMMSVHKMVFVDKDSATLFNHDGIPEIALSFEKLVLALLSFQCFAAGGRGEGSADSLEAGLARQGSALHTFLRRDSLLDTVHANLLTKEQIEGLSPLHWGCPLWEIGVTRADELLPKRGKITTGYLSRLVPATRFLWLQDDQRGVAAHGGMSFVGFPESRDPFTTIVVVGAEGRKVVPAHVDQAPWRQLHSLVVRRAIRDGVGGPLAFENLEADDAFDIWAGGLAGDQAKVVDAVESVFHVPAAMLQSTGQRCYEEGVRLAETAARRLTRAMGRYRLVLESNEAGLNQYVQRQERQKKSERERHESTAQSAVAAFWTEAERNVPLLLAAVRSASRPADPESWSQSDWGQAIRHAAREAYEFASPRQTSRQIRAFVSGLAVLFSNRDQNTTTMNL